MSYPPPPPGYGPPPPPYGPGQGGGAVPPGYGQPPRKGNANGVLAAMVAGVVIVLGIVISVVLVTSDSNKDVAAPGGSGSNRATGSGQRPIGSGQRPPSGEVTGGGSHEPSSGPSIPSYAPPTGSNDLSGATSTGNDYFQDLDLNLYYTSRGDWCSEDAFPLTQADVMAVTSASALGSATGSSGSATMEGTVSLNDGRTGTLTITLQPESDGSSQWCIIGQSNLS